MHLLNGVFGTLAVALFYNFDIASTIAALPPVDSSGAVIPPEKWAMMDQLMVQLKSWCSRRLVVRHLARRLPGPQVHDGNRVTPEEEFEVSMSASTATSAIRTSWPSR